MLPNKYGPIEITGYRAFLGNAAIFFIVVICLKCIIKDIRYLLYSVGSFQQTKKLWNGILNEKVWKLAILFIVDAGVAELTLIWP